MVVERVFRVAFIGLLNGGEGVHGERGETERGLIGKFISRCSAVIVDDVCRTAMPTRQLKCRVARETDKTASSAAAESGRLAREGYVRE